MVIRLSGESMDVSELEGAELDLAVAQAGKEWGTAHEWFPTMTLDPTFTGAEIRAGKCYLIPHNPMRQNPQVFDPSVSWWLGGPIIEREGITVQKMDYVELGRTDWQASLDHFLRTAFAGRTPLIAAMRAFVASKTYNVEFSGGP